MGHMTVTTVTTRTECRMDALAIGMLAAVVVRSEACQAWLAANRTALRLLLALLAAGVVLLWLYAYGSATPGMQTIGFTWIAVFYAALLLLAFEHREGWFAWTLRSRLLRELGTVSYCVYLIHLVMNVGVHAVLLRAPPRISTAAGAAVAVLGLLMTYLVAKMSWLLFEGLLQRRGHAFKY
jgi:peptidoglycan/LPS O-acetylase OafA/YrhL